MSTPSLQPNEIGVVAASMLGIDVAETEWQLLQEGEGAIVIRGAGIIAKHFANSANFDTELAGFDTLARLSPGSGPSLRAASSEELTILMEDLGDAPAMADVLLGADPQAAEQALFDYVDALAELHRATSGQVGPPPGSGWFSEVADRAIKALSSELSPPMTGMTAETRAQFEQALSRLLNPGKKSVFSFGDMCPDNNLMTPGGFKFIDLEGSGFVDPALDLANIALPFPTCWCCWDLPAAVRRNALDRYVDARGESALIELDSAALVFGVLTLGVTAVRVLDRDDDIETRSGHVLPIGRSRTLHRLARTVEILEDSGRYDESRHWLTDSHQALTEAWPDTTPLLLAPAFRATA